MAQFYEGGREMNFRALVSKGLLIIVVVAALGLLAIPGTHRSTEATTNVAVVFAPNPVYMVKGQQANLGMILTVDLKVAGALQGVRLVDEDLFADDLLIEDNIPVPAGGCVVGNPCLFTHTWKLKCNNNPGLNEVVGVGGTANGGSGESSAEGAIEFSAGGANFGSVAIICGEKPGGPVGGVAELLDADDPASLGASESSNINTGFSSTGVLVATAAFTIVIAGATAWYARRRFIR